MPDHPEGVIRVLLVDDEPLAREGLRLRLAGEPDVEIVGECGDGEEAVRALRELAPDLVFLDIQLPGLNGLEVLDRLAGRPPVVVFVTAYDRYAIAAFERHALDYLLKPFDAPRLARTLARVRGELARRDRDAIGKEVLEALREFRREPRYLERLAVRTTGRHIFLRLDEVDWIEAAENYVRVHTAGRGHLVRETMSGMVGKLDPARFLRIHRSAIVNVDRIRAIEALDTGELAVVLEDGTRLPTSRSYRAAIEELIRRSH